MPNTVDVCKTGLEYILNQAEQNDVVEKKTVTEVCRDIAIRDDVGDGEIFEDCQGNYCTPRLYDGRLREGIIQWLHELKLEKQRSMTQTTIEDNFPQK